MIAEPPETVQIAAFVPISESVAFLDKPVCAEFHGNHNQQSVFTGLAKLDQSTKQTKVLSDLICSFCFDFACQKPHQGLSSCTCVEGQCNTNECLCLKLGQSCTQYCLCRKDRCAYQKKLTCKCEHVCSFERCLCQKDPTGCTEACGCSCKQVPSVKMGVSKSNIKQAGYGLFALEQIKKDTLLGTYVGEHIPK